MNSRLPFSVALVAVLICLWLVMTMPMCQEGFVASLGRRLNWTCVPDNP